MAFADLLLGALAVLLATSLGALSVVLFRRLGKGFYPAMLAFSAGVMAYSSVEMIGAAHSSSGDAATALGFLVGLLALYIMEKGIPHAHHFLRRKEMAASTKKAALIAGAISLHNVPEGLAVAAAFASSTPLGWLVTASIALQDVPEGLLVSAPLALYGVRLRRCLEFGILSGAVEAGAAVAGYFLFSFAAPVVPFGLSFSAGAMAFVVLVELLPDAMKNGRERAAALSFALGIAAAFGMATLFAL
ncbi:MAG: ZIP family metal transporter [Candidatus ainarchaeum sp.]|nr:ZIP family metal transporter [Candidatus ainarchaeum sp.]